MITVTNIEVLADLASLRKNVAEAVSSGYGAMRDYAIALNAEFAYAWFDIEANDKSAQGVAVRTEKEALFEILKEKNHTNVSTVWGRVRKYGKEEAKLVGTHGMPMPAYDDEGNLITEAEAGESGKSGNKSPMLRNIDDLTALYKFNGRQESLDARITRAQLHIAAALAELGVDLSMVKTK